MQFTAAAQSASDSLTWPDVAGLIVLSVFMLMVILAVLGALPWQRSKDK